MDALYSGTGLEREKNGEVRDASPEWRKSIKLLEGSLTLPAHLSDRNGMKLKMLELRM